MFAGISTRSCESASVHWVSRTSSGLATLDGVSLRTKNCERPAAVHLGRLTLTDESLLIDLCADLRRRVRLC